MRLALMPVQPAREEIRGSMGLTEETHGEGTPEGRQPQRLPQIKELFTPNVCR